MWKNKRKNFKIAKAQSLVTSQSWFHHWIGGDISVIPNDVEMFGYLRDVARAIIKNDKNEQSVWLSYAKGIFSKLILELEINQYLRKGVRVKMHVQHGEGAVCTNGIVERL